MDIPYAWKEKSYFIIFLQSLLNSLPFFFISAAFVVSCLVCQNIGD